MKNKAPKNKSAIIGLIDYLLCALIVPFGPLGVLLAFPWCFKQKRIWQKNAKASPRALILRGFTVEKLNRRGKFEHYLPFQNPGITWMGILDATNAIETEIEIADDLHLIAWQSPGQVRYLEAKGLAASAAILREPFAALKIARFCVEKRIGVLRAVKHNYPALQACLVSCIIGIPFIVDICGNYELITRLTGKTFYFKTLSKIPLLGQVAHRASNWLLGWPIRRAVRVLGRNKNNYEHGFALGAPVDRLSLLRISNFNAAFNAYNPEQPPARPADYPYILFVGRLAKINFPLDVIDAFNIAGPQLPDHRLVIIGDGAIRTAVEQRIEQSDVKDRIVFLGSRPSDELLNWTAHAAAAICPYSGSTLVEAMLCSIPVIAYDVEWHAEVVIDDYTGFLVPFGDTRALAAKIVHVISDYQEAQKVGQCGRDLARVVFDKEKIYAKETNIYTQALSAN
jgi:glycosyltransferase involved in cell wall biosynthesis